MKPYAPPPPPGASPPPLWGDEQHARELFGDRVTDLTVERRTLVMRHDGDPTATSRELLAGWNHADPYQRMRERLRDELGTDPGPALREVHQQILSGAAAPVPEPVVPAPVVDARTAGRCCA